MGDPQVTARLNDNKDLIKRANKLARVESELGEFKLKIERYMKISPQPNGSLLVVNTLPRKAGLVGLNATLDTQLVFEFAAIVEAAL